MGLLQELSQSRMHIRSYKTRWHKQANVIPNQSLRDSSPGSTGKNISTPAQTNIQCVNATASPTIVCTRTEHKYKTSSARIRGSQFSRKKMIKVHMYGAQMQDEEPRAIEGRHEHLIVIDLKLCYVTLIAQISLLSAVPAGQGARRPAGDSVGTKKLPNQVAMRPATRPASQPDTKPFTLPASKIEFIKI